MRYPKFLKTNDTIGIIATSCGNNHKPYSFLARKSIEVLSEDYKIKKAHRIFRQKDLVSGPHELRASDFNSFYFNPRIDVIWSTGGGELMCGMLPYVNFEKIKKANPKFFIGFSDNTNLTFTLTTICDVATIYGMSSSALAKTKTKDIEDNLDLISGNKLEFDSYEKYEDLTEKFISDDIFAKKDYTLDVVYKSLDGNNHDFKGRIIGGCLDIIVTLIGTKFDNISNFIEKYKEDGIIWYFDVCDLNAPSFYRALFQLENAGCFKYLKGVLIGRVYRFYEFGDYSYLKAMEQIFEKYNVPVIYDVDISHVKPSLAIINGAICEFKYFDNKGKIKFVLK